MKEYKIFHVTRNLAKHSFELDDAIHGSPLPKENTDWTDETDGEQENREESSLQGSPVSKLITHNLLWHIPSQEQTGDE